MAVPKLIVRQQKSLLWNVGVSAGCVMVLLVCFIVGRYFAVDEQNEAIDRAKWLETELDKFERAYKQTNEELVMQIQTAKVDDQSRQQLVETVKRLQEAHYKLESELSFYRKIMAPEKDQQGLTLTEFSVARSSSTANPRFKLVLTQAGKQEQFLKGQLELSVSGKLNGVQKKYSFNELGDYQSKDFKFQFRYFQNFEGELLMPEGFVAEVANLKAKTSGLRENQIIEKQINLE